MREVASGEGGLLRLQLLQLRVLGLLAHVFRLRASVSNEINRWMERKTDLHGFLLRCLKVGVERGVLRLYGGELRLHGRELGWNRCELWLQACRVLEG